MFITAESASTAQRHYLRNDTFGWQKVVVPPKQSANIVSVKIMLQPESGFLLLLLWFSVLLRNLTEF